VTRRARLVAEQRRVQEIRRPDDDPVAGNLSRGNPGGGFTVNTVDALRRPPR